MKQVEICHTTEKAQNAKDTFKNAQMKKIEKGPTNAELGLIVTTGEVQVQNQAHHAKAVAERVHLGCEVGPLGPSLLKRFVGSLVEAVWHVSMYTCAKPFYLGYKKELPLHFLI